MFTEMLILEVVVFLLIAAAVAGVNQAYKGAGHVRRLIRTVTVLEQRVERLDNEAMQRAEYLDQARLRITELERIVSPGATEMFPTMHKGCKPLTK